MITSPQPAEGKTLTSVNLALTFSKVYNQTVLLVDCDLRHQNVHKVLGFESNSGLMNCLLKDQPLEELRGEARRRGDPGRSGNGGARA